MALYLVVVTPFQFYRIGDEITDPITVDTVRASEYESCVVMVSDEVIPPPTPQPTPTLAELQAMYRQLLQQSAGTQAALDSANALNASQSADLAAQQQKIQELANAIMVLKAKVENPNGGIPLPPDLADDVPLREDDGIGIVTDKGARLVGDVR